jgi:hypothetical protein
MGTPNKIKCAILRGISGTHNFRSEYVSASIFNIRYAINHIRS